MVYEILKVEGNPPLSFITVARSIQLRYRRLQDRRETAPEQIRQVEVDNPRVRRSARFDMAFQAKEIKRHERPPQRPDDEENIDEGEAVTPQSELDRSKNEIEEQVQRKGQRNEPRNSPADRFPEHKSEGNEYYYVQRRPHRPEEPHRR